MGLHHEPITLDAANAFIGLEHRHNAAVLGHKYALGAYRGDRLVGVVVVGRTTARGLHDPQRAEVTRLATDGTDNACSFLYQRAKRVAQAMGFLSLKTYTRSDESGASLRAIGACCEEEIKARSWATSSKARPRKQPKSKPTKRKRWELMPGRPALRFHGGKWRLAPWIISNFFEHTTYVEPYAGGASVLLRKARSPNEVYNDLDGEVVNVFRVLRNPEQAAELERLLQLTPWSRREFRDAYKPTEDPIERARHTIVRSFMAHGTTSRRESRTGFRGRCWPDGGGGAGDWPGYCAGIAQFTRRLERVVIEDAPALDVIKRYDAPDALIYCDPPYPLGTRKSIRWSTEGDRCYAHEMTDDDHRELAAALHRARAAVVISGYACSLYDDELYVGWERVQKDTVADRGAARTEILWMKPAGSRRAPSGSLIQSSLLDEVG